MLRKKWFKYYFQQCLLQCFIWHMTDYVKNPVSNNTAIHAQRKCYKIINVSLCGLVRLEPQPRISARTISLLQILINVCFFYMPGFIDMTFN